VADDETLGFALVVACGAMTISAQQPSAEVSYFREIRRHFSAVARAAISLR